jgi:hypothetical protein
VGRKALLALDTVVSPDTLMRWHQRLVAQKWDFSKRRGPGRPGIMHEISQLIVRIGAGEFWMGLHANSRGAGQSNSPGRARIAIDR